MAEQERPARPDLMGHSQPPQRSRDPSAELKLLYDTAPVGLGFVDTDLRYIRLNEQLAAINGRQVAAHLGRTVREIIPEIAPQVEPLHLRVIETGEPVLNLEVHGSTPAAPERDYLVSYYPVKADDGSVQGVSIVVQDITERKQAEAALREREEVERRFSEQLTVLHEVTNQLSTAGSLADLCRAAVELGRSRLGFDRLGIWFVGEDRASATGTFGVDEKGQLRDERGSRVSISPASVAGQVIASKRPFVLREEGPTLDHEAEVVGRGSHAIAALWNGAEVIGFISTDNLLLHQPITERQCRILTLYASALGHLCAVKRLEEALRGRAEELAEADRHKDEFLALLAHELRNPLSPMLNAVELLKARASRSSYYVSGKDEVPPDTLFGLRNTQYGIRDALPIIDRQARHMARLVDDLLDVSRITRGRVELRKERVDLTEVARNAIETSRPLIEEREHILSVSLPLEPVWLDADPARLEQILTNLLNNAAKYTEPGGRISLSVVLESTTRCAVITVRDTGVGLAPELVSRVFDLFTQADRSLDRAQGGLGIGLTLVRSLAELHGGSVHAASAGPGQGSAFLVRLPLVSDELRVTRDEPGGVSRSLPAGDGLRQGEAAARHTPRRVLVVDDHEDAASTLAELLLFWGHEVRVAHDGRQALEEARRYQPDVILLDIGLPQMDGYEVARRLCELPERPTMRLVAVTGYGQEEDRRKAQAAGFDDHLVKPVDPDALQRLLAAASHSS